MGEEGGGRVGTYWVGEKVGVHSMEVLAGMDVDCDDSSVTRGCHLVGNMRCVEYCDGTIVRVSPTHCLRVCDSVDL